MNLFYKYTSVTLFLIGNISFCLAQKVNVSGFEVYQNEDNVLVHWNIDSGATCNGITILRSINDTMQFSEIGHIGGICGNSTSSTPYNFSDENPEFNKTNYYKIRMGFSQFSEIKNIHISYIEPGSILIKPNPANAIFNIAFNNNKNKTYSIEIINDKGQQIESIKNITENFYTLNSAFFSPGTYFILLQDNEGIVTKSKMIVTP